jgi:hypothetical protein
MEEKQILNYGADEQLLTYRAMVLEIAGYRVYSAMCQEEAGPILDRNRIDLLILCHSLSVEECKRVAAWARTIHGEMKVLLLCGHNGCRTLDMPIESLEEIVITPRFLLSKVAACLGDPFAGNGNRTSSRTVSRMRS